MLPVPLLRRLMKLGIRLKRSRLLWLGVAVVGLAVTFSLLFMVFEGLDFFTALYWAVITMSTIGYGDITPGTEAGRIVAMVAAIAGISSFTALVSLIAEYFLTSSLRRMMGMHSVKFRDHYVVIGQGASVKAFVEELLPAMERGEVKRRPLVVILPDEEERRKLELPEEVDVIIGDPTNRETLRRARVEDAGHVVLTLEDDSKAVFVTLMVKGMSGAKVYVEALKEESLELLKNAGADRVILSRGIAGRLLASSIFEPEVVDVLEDLMRSSRGYDLVIIEEKEFWGLEFGEVLRRLSGKCLPVGYAKGSLRLAPSLDERIPEGAKIVCIRPSGD
ncbi:potassium channel family protein [Pyrococcus yayanosii]|uniref:Calcium-gated potassium channel protein n=1 Tax=Pyrococcus yayanosii (strain CH1 / JCM 16557) TaxID=529709 RepID=F8AHL1_PYRYC|nr:ion channel [Pyrococcus yayanosii]AEH25382.1 calcium-gated potassium channel protein [Pyrococcus yayanosii CH1]